MLRRLTIYYSADLLYRYRGIYRMLSTEGYISQLSPYLGMYLGTVPRVESLSYVCSKFKPKDFRFRRDSKVWHRRHKFVPFSNAGCPTTLWRKHIRRAAIYPYIRGQKVRTELEGL
jgi:hypothetical protein